MDSGRRPLVIDADIELFLTGWLRLALAARTEEYCQRVEVSNREPDEEDGEPFPERLVIIRYDGGAETSIITSDGSIGVSVLAGTKSHPRDANDLARMVKALIRSCPAADTGNPVAKVIASNGPYEVQEDQARARRYMTFTLGLVGQAIA